MTFDFTQPLALRIGFPVSALRAKVEKTQATAGTPAQALRPVLASIDERGIAHLDITGAIFETDAQTARAMGFTRPSDIERALLEAKESPAIKGAILHVDSPGGQTQGIQELADMLYTLGKPSIAHTRGECCSAAYWLASQCDRVLASRAATIGSLGVYCVVEDNSKEMEHAGVECVLFSTGSVKGAGEYGVPLTQAQRAFMQESVDALGELFKQSVLRKRKAFDPVHFTGAYWLAEHALELGLVDDLTF